MEGAGIISELQWHLLELIRDGQSDSEQAESLRDRLESLKELDESEPDRL